MSDAEVVHYYYCKQTKKLMQKKKTTVTGSIATLLQLVFLRVYPTLWAFHRLILSLESP